MMKTTLKDRTLWYDGTNQVDPELVPELILSGVPISKIKVNYIDDDVARFNQLSDVLLDGIKDSVPEFDLSWKIPSEFMSINLENYLSEKITQMHISNPPEYASRLSSELDQVKTRGLEIFIKTVIYIISEFKKKDVVWGVGRGSSCASLILYLIGLHKVDPIKYKIPLTEFFHD